MEIDYDLNAIRIVRFSRSLEMRWKLNTSTPLECVTHGMEYGTLFSVGVEDKRICDLYSVWRFDQYGLINTVRYFAYLALPFV